jgi:hypothetical protein
MKKGKRTIPVKIQPRLYRIAPFGLWLEFPRSLSQFVTGLYIVGYNAHEENVNTQYNIMTKTPETELICHFTEFNLRVQFFIAELRL